MDIAAATDRERQALADTLDRVGSAAPTLCPPWTTAELVAHVVSLDRAHGALTFAGRWLVSRGVRLNDRAGGLTARAIARERAPFGELVDRLRRPTPSLLRRPSVAIVGLFEVWVHHYDVSAANGIDRGDAPAELEAVIPWLLRYHHALFESQPVRVEAGSASWSSGAPASVVVRGDVPDLVLWLAGRLAMAQVEFAGPAAAVDALRSAPRI